jgi:Glycosyltransferase sugar-binding region containing DXD motif
MLTADPPSRVAACLAPLRALADEVVIAADSSVDERTLAGYAALADRLFRIEFVRSERHLAWLHAQCDGDWILRLDGDEIPSRALIDELPALLASRRVQQYWTPRAWVYPDAEHTLGDAPWSEDFVNRLVRNDGTLRISGQAHTDVEPLTPRAYLDQPLYHLDLLTSTHQQRRDKVIRYEAYRSGLLAAGGGRLNEAFYLPELRDSLDLRAIPEEDRAAIASALTGSSKPQRQGSVEHARFVSLEAMDRLWEGRPVDDDAYRATIEPREASITMAPSERRSVFFRVRNEGSERWPASLEQSPEIRLSYRWLTADTSGQVTEGPRSAFPHAVEPGERVLTPLHVDAPAIAGDYLLEVDIVHEHVRWFDCALRLPVRVEHPRSLPSAELQLRETPAPRLARWRRIRIPRTIHRVWLGEKALPEEHERFAATFARHHPDWEMRLWTDADLPTLDICAPQRELARTHAELSNLVRYEVLHRHGGVYVDTDVECRRPWTPLLRGIDAFAALEIPGGVCNAILGAVAGHPAFARAARLARDTLGTGAHSPDANGPRFLSLVLEQEPNVAILPASLFYPYLWDEPERRHETFPDAYAVHHWTLSWLADG